jgi:NAD(P)-dependent dehydrogenase (short-subunit alcohol dehydrogenase family)
VIVTGANAGLGFETTKDLARRGGKIIMASRNIQKAQQAEIEIKKEVPSADLVIMKLDLSSMKSVREFVQKFKSEQNRLDILVNNAGVMPTQKEITSENLEANFAANHFGPFLLTNLLLDLMRKTGNSRILIVASAVHALARSFDLDNLNAEKYFGRSIFVYAQTKLANILFMRELDRRLRASGIKPSEICVNALTPGYVKTGLDSNSIPPLWPLRILIKIRHLFAKTPWEGAQTQIHLAVAEEVEELTGLFWENCQERWISTLAQDVKLAKDLWTKSAAAVGLKPEETIFK